MRPDRVFDRMLQHERTALAWERTAFAMIVVGLLLVRAGASLGPLFAVPGVAQVLIGSLLMVWTGRHYDELHGPLRDGQSPVHPRAARLVGASTAVFLGCATVIAVAVTVQ